MKIPAMLSYLLEASIAISILYIVYRILLSQYRNFHFNRIFILVALSLSALLPFIELPADTSLVYMVGMPTFTLAEIDFVASQEKLPVLARRFTGVELLMLIYWIGVCMTSIRLGLQLVRLWRQKQAFTYQSQEGYQLIYTQGQLPTFSFFKWLFWDDSQKLTERETELILLHEKTHMHQWHSADILLTEVYKILFWFHPVVYAFQKSQRAIHEYLADQAALQEGSSEIYIRLLTHSLLKKLNIPLVQSFYHSSLKSRISMLRSVKTNKPTTWKAVASILSALVLILVYACRSQDSINPSTRTTSVDQMPEYSGGTDALYREISQTIRYPLSARKAGAQGQVVASYTINKEGKLENIEITQGVHSDVDQEVIRVLSNLKQTWTPGQKGKQATNVKMALPIQFVLEGKDKSNSASGGKGLVVVGYAPSDNISTDEPFVAVEHMPEFPGGFPKLGEFLADNLKYPAESREKGVYGTVFLSFVVKENGDISDIKIAKGVNAEMDAEALRVAKLMPKWIPGKQSGKEVPVRFSLPIKFTL
ncbi:M56 family metallopeptidase [Xanthocytophaga flava]|uniref:M56 family metallopeptidase n=1 Tax=Xanthocytophaga flava TaxID=3048013 RepID=UPI0028D44D62|nr:M56 family metallopeptidase [Xanthocytophaga flavus]MDJ1466212.1 M56 family metallopeptidase [Xanthocytophaga flavus]